MKERELTADLINKAIVGHRYTLENLQERLNCLSKEKVELAIAEEKDLFSCEDFRIDFETDTGKNGCIWFLKTRTGNLYITEIAMCKDLLQVLP